MKFLAAYVMRGRLQAITAYLGLATLATLLPPITSPFNYLSAAVVALVTLRKGAQAGLLLVVSVVVYLLIVSVITSSSPFMVPSLVGLIVLSAIIWGIALVLRLTGSLALSATVAAGLGLLAVIITYIAIGDPATWWQAMLKEAFAPIIEQSITADQKALSAAFDEVAPHMTGILAGAVTINIVVCLFIARWWQAVLYNPGGFQTEFHEFRLGKFVAIFTAILAVLSLLSIEYLSTMASDLLKVVLTLFVLQGLSIAHAVITLKKMQTAWLVGAYVILVFMSKLLAMVGFIDTWINIRTRVGNSTSGRN